MATPRGHAPLRLHQRCELTTYGQGEILFVGQTSFSPGLWAGIALDEPNGKHDGVVQGKRYFAATPGHGIFVRASQVKVVEDGDEEDGEDDLAREEVAVALPTPRTSATSSRTPSRAAASPVKATASKPRTTTTMPPPSSSAPLSRPRISSPAKPTGSRSPLKTPARGSAGSTPLTSRPSSTTGRFPTTASPAMGMAARTPGVRANTATTSTRTPAAPPPSRSVARSAVQAAKAPDVMTARAGLRPVVKARPSMAPPGALQTTTPARTTRTPAAATSARRVGGAVTPGARSAGSSSTTRTPALGNTRTSTPSSRRIDAAFADEEDEDLLAMTIDEGSLERNLQSSSDSAELAELQAEGLASPSLRKGPPMAHQDHMSLSRGPSMTSINRNTAEVAAMQRELDELRAKVRIAEKKREEDREKIKEAERIQIESEQFLAVKPKLTAKQQELQDELKDLHKMEKDWGLQREELERQINEMNDQLEITTLDREVAEEKAEGALEELRAMTDRVEELQVDIEVLREENALFEQGPVDDKDKLSVGYIQLEKQNERLKDALLRLRDMTAESDTDLRRRISQLEKDLSALDDLQASYESVCAKLETSDALLEDLKIQLDDALGAEEMLEKLTERNMALTDRVEEMAVAIEDLESLKELNDELEETHLETEKQLQEEVDLKDMQLRDHQMRNDLLEANIVDYENTFGQFRELVLNLQSEVEAARNDDKARESGKGSGDEQAMLNLNLKLQSSTLKSQAKTIELEIGKLQAHQALDNLEMISPYLPKEYFDHDKDACDSLLFFQRIAAKTDIIKTIVEGNHDIAGSLVGVVDESLINVCKMRHSLAHFIVFSRQIAAVIQRASVPTFLKSGRMYKELTSIERRIDYYIDHLREETLNEDECGKEFNRFVRLLEDFDFALVEGSNEGLYSDLAAKELGSAILFDLDLDTIAAALGYSKQNIAGLYNDYLAQQGSEEGEIVFHSNESDINDSLFQPLQDLINNIRSAKVPARKLLRRLSNLYDNSEAVKMDAIVKLPGLGKLSSQLVEFSTILVGRFSVYTGDVRVNKNAFELKAVLAFVEEATREVLSGEHESLWSLTRNETARLSQTVSELLGAATEQDNVMKISGPYPWLGRVEEIKRAQSENQESQKVILKQAEDLKDMYKQTKIRDEVLQENTIKIERLSKQLQKSKLELNAVGVLKDDLSDMTKRMKAYEEGNSALQGELEQLQREYERAIKEGVAAKEPVAVAVAAGEEQGSAAAASALPTAVGYARGATMSSSSLETSYLLDQLEAMRGALRYLRMENNMLKSRDVLARLDALPPLLPVPSVEDAGQEGQAGVPKPRKETVIGSDGGTAGEASRLVHDWIKVVSSPRVVTLAKPQRTDEQRVRRAWTPMAQLPQTQYAEQSRERSRIQQRIRSLHDRLSTSSVVSLQA